MLLEHKNSSFWVCFSLSARRLSSSWTGKVWGSLATHKIAKRWPDLQNPCLKLKNKHRWVLIFGGNLTNTQHFSAGAVFRRRSCRSCAAATAIRPTRRCARAATTPAARRRWRWHRQRVAATPAVTSRWTRRNKHTPRQGLSKARNESLVERYVSVCACVCFL